MFTFTNKEVGSLLTNEKCFYDLYDLYMYRNFKYKLVLVFEDLIVYELPLKMISVKWAVACAERYLHLFEKERPDDNRPRKAIETAKQWIIDKTDDNTAAAAAYAAYAAATAATTNATNAARIAAYASRASTSAASVARAAARSADTSANASEQKWSRNKFKEIIGEYLNDYKRDLKNTLIVLIIPELSDIIIKYVV